MCSRLAILKRFRIYDRKTELNRFNLIPDIEMVSHSTPIIPRGSFQVACEKIGGSFGVGDHLESCLGRFWGSFRIGDHFGSCTDHLLILTT